MSWFVKLRKNKGKGAEVGRLGPFSSRATAIRQGQALADSGELGPGILPSVESASRNPASTRTNPTESALRRWQTGSGMRGVAGHEKRPAPSARAIHRYLADGRWERLPYGAFLIKGAGTSKIAVLSPGRSGRPDMSYFTYWSPSAARADADKELGRTFTSEIPIRNKMIDAYLSGQAYDGPFGGFPASTRTNPQIRPGMPLTYSRRPHTSTPAPTGRKRKTNRRKR